MPRPPSASAPISVARRPAWDWMLAWLFLPAFLLDQLIDARHDRFLDIAADDLRAFARE